MERKRSIDSRVIFGLIWEVLVTGVTLAVIFATDKKAETPIPPLLFLLIFHAVGIWMLITGIKQTVLDRATLTHGEEKYALITAIFPSGSSNNGVPLLSANLEVIDSFGNAQKYTERLSQYERYSVGNVLKVLHYKNNIIIIDQVKIDELPYNIRDYVDRYIQSNFAFCYNTQNYSPTTVNKDEIIINGEIFRKK